MEGRGRKSAASLSVIHGGGAEASSDGRPDPPDDLEAEAAVEWRAMVGRMPDGWFPRPTWPLLAQYCRHVVSSRRVQKLVRQIEAMEDIKVADYDRALKMQERETRMIASLATKMRIAQQSTVDRRIRPHDHSAARASGKPWDYE